MRRGRLIRRAASLTHYGRSSLALGAGAMISTAVLTGALLVGDSVRYSLGQMTLDRLGGVNIPRAATRLRPVTWKTNSSPAR